MTNQYQAPTTTADAEIRPFRIEIPQAEVDDLHERWPAPAGPTSCPAPAGAGAFR